MRYLLILFLIFSPFVFAEVPIKEFHQVDENIYRGARPSVNGIRLLAIMGIKTIINLENSNIIVEQKNVDRYGMIYFSFPMSPFFIPTQEKVDNILRIMDDEYFWPIFIHCKHGQDRTGLIIGLYRFYFNGWTPREAYQEMRRYNFHPILLGLRLYYRRETGY
jgi:protein tyrosine/serine phosphatase